MEKLDLSVEGMSCTGCEQTVTNAVEQVKGVHRVEANHESGSVEVTVEEGHKEDVQRAIHDAGFDVPA